MYCICSLCPWWLMLNGYKLGFPDQHLLPHILAAGSLFSSKKNYSFIHRPYILCETDPTPLPFPSVGTGSRSCQTEHFRKGVRESQAVGNEKTVHSKDSTQVSTRWIPQGMEFRGGSGKLWGIGALDACWGVWNCSWKSSEGFRQGR